jgi:hypothetical protein
MDKQRSLPKFNPNQIVQFIGGSGKIKHCKPDAGTWTYTVEMDMGSPPEMGRIGFETTILLHEADILRSTNNEFPQTTTDAEICALSVVS